MANFIIKLMENLDYCNLKLYICLHITSDQNFLYHLYHKLKFSIKLYETFILFIQFRPHFYLILSQLNQITEIPVCCSIKGNYVQNVTCPYGSIWNVIW